MFVSYTPHAAITAPLPQRTHAVPEEEYRLGAFCIKGLDLDLTVKPLFFPTGKVYTRVRLIWRVRVLEHRLSELNRLIDRINDRVPDGRFRYDHNRYSLEFEPKACLSSRAKTPSEKLKKAVAIALKAWETYANALDAVIWREVWSCDVLRA